MSKVSPEGGGDAWQHGLCDWCGPGMSNCCLCWAATCCNCVTIPQLYEKVMGQPGACKKYFGICCLLAILGQVLLVIPATASFASLFNTIQYIMLFFLLMTVRAKVRQDNGIAPAPCDCCGCDDCCTTFWCECCVSIQIFKELGVTGGKYSLFTSTGEASVAPPSV